MDFQVMLNALLATLLCVAIAANVRQFYRMHTSADRMDQAFDEMVQARNNLVRQWVEEVKRVEALREAYEKELPRPFNWVELE